MAVGRIASEDWAGKTYREAIDLGRAICYLRGSRSQAEVAAEAGLDPSTWSHYESGRRLPRRENLSRVLRGLGCTRLELEERAWKLQRARLLKEERASLAGRPLPSAEPSGMTRADTVDLLALRASDLVEKLVPGLVELLVFMVSGGRR